MKRVLNELCAGIEMEQLPADASNGGHGVAVEALAIHSGAVTPGALFFGIPGSKTDGAKFLEDAVLRGAVAAVLTERSAGEKAALRERFPAIALLFVNDIRGALSTIAARFYGEPAAKMLTIGVTGTNGKTSVSWILAEALARLGRPSAYIGTLGVRQLGPDGELIAGEETVNTTPDPSVIHSMLAECYARGARSAVIEATSGGLVQRRTAAVPWDGALFTNLTRDHLDIHGTMEEYGAAKRLLFFDELRRSSKPQRVAVVNIDDPFGAELARDLVAEVPAIRVITYSTAGEGAAADATVVRSGGSLSRTSLDCIILGEPLRLESSLIGLFNVANLVGAATMLRALGFPASEVERAIAQVPQVPGRLELVSDGAVHVVVDYAHTPDALVKAQRSLRELGSKRLITVFGCGGDRDRGKRPLMARAVEEHADVAVVTSDNPRTEDPQQILSDIAVGFGAGQPAGSRCEVRLNVDRRSAIGEAIACAQSGDIVLIAGKGHEDYQEIQGVKHPFSDQEICRSLLSRQ